MIFFSLARMRMMTITLETNAMPQMSTQFVSVFEYHTSNVNFFG